MKTSAIALTLLLAVPAAASAADTTVVERLLGEYAGKSGATFDANTGKSLWTKSFTSNEEPKTRSCASCHTENLSATGTHAKTRKTIEPLAPSANAERLTDAKTIEKWFLRNCKWTMGRECTPEEKGHFLKYISVQ